MKRVAAAFVTIAVALPATAATPGERPRLAFLDLTAPTETDRAMASTAGDLLVVALSDTGKFEVITRNDVKALLGYEAQAQLLGCAESSCMVDLGGAVGAAYLVSGSLGRLGDQQQLSLSLIDVNHATVSKRTAVSVPNERALPQAIREAVQKLTGTLVPDSGPIDACSGPPCAKDAVTTCKRWWEKEWDALTIIGIVPDGPYEQQMVEHKPSRTFRMLVRTRSRDGSRSEYLAYIRYERVEGDWFFDEGSMRHLRDLPITPDDPPPANVVEQLLAAGFSGAHNHAKVTRIALNRFPDYSRAKDGAPATWSWTFDVTWKDGAKTQTCPRATAKLAKAGNEWHYGGEAADGASCTEVLDAE